MILQKTLTKVSDHVVVVVDQYTKGLTDNQTRPYDDIAPTRAKVSLHVFAEY